MDNSYRILDWDSQFFGYKIASLKPWKLESERLNEIIADLKKNDIKLIYCFINPDDEISNRSVLNMSGFLADKK